VGSVESRGARVIDGVDSASFSSKDSTPDAALTRTRHAAGLRALSIVLIGFALLAAARALYFYLYPGFPFAYYKDLGVDFQITEYIRHSIHSWTDFSDTLSWASWWDQPLFYLNPYLSYAAIVPVSSMLGNAWAGIKLLQVLQIVLAGIGAYWLMRLCGRAARWACIAGMLYAFIPIVPLQTRGNLDLGWPYVLAPLSFAIGIAVLRRLGVYGLPVCAVVCSLFGLCTASEFLIFLSFPVYCVLATYAFKRSMARLWLLNASIGTLFLLTTGAYFILPSIDESLFTDSAARAVQLQTLEILSLYSQTWDTMLALVPRESVVSPSPLFNATPYLPLALIGGFICWCSALFAIFTVRAQLRTRTAVALLVVGAVCFILSFGVYAPFGSPLWFVLSKIPKMGAIRTPDRYMLLPSLFVAVAAAEGVRLLWQRPRTRTYASIALTIVFSSFFIFGIGAHFWENENDVGAAEPHLQQVNAIVSAEGARTASFGLVNGGSPFDYSSYGVPTPTMSGVMEFGSRYGQDGVAGLGIFRRSGVRTVIATPMWAAADADGMPDYATIYRKTAFASVIFDSRENVIVTKVDRPDAMITPVRMRCYSGGPGALDRLFVSKDFEHVAVVRPAAHCPDAIYANYDPRDALTARNAHVFVAGTALCGTCTPLQDADYRYYPGRSLFNKPWYRNSIDGDALIFSSAGAALIDDSAEFNVPLPRQTGGRNWLWLRCVSHGSTQIRVTLPDFSSKIITLLPSTSMRWISIPFTMTTGQKIIHLSISSTPMGPGQLGYTWSGLALDGVAVVDARERAQALAGHVPRGDVAVDSVRVEQHVEDAGPSPVVLTPNVLSRPVSLQGVVSTLVDDQRSMEVRGSAGGVWYRWSGAAGPYLLRAQATVQNVAGSIVIGISHSPRTCCARSAARAFATSPATDVFQRVRLRRGEYIAAQMFIKRRGAQSFARFGAIEVIPAQNGPTPVQALAGKEEANVYLGSARALALFDSSRRITDADFSRKSLKPSAGARVSVHVNFTNAPKLVTAGLATSGKGIVRVRLACGRNSVSGYVHQSREIVLRNASKSGDCRVAVFWVRSLRIQNIRLNSLGKLVDVAGAIWLPKGDYRLTAQAKDGRVMRPQGMLFDGAASATQIRVPHSGFHTLRLRAARFRPVFLLFVNRHRAPVSSVEDITAKQIASLRWVVRVRKQTDLKVNHLYDGHWILKGARSTLDGAPCNITSTCFPATVPGEYVLIHAWPRSLQIGMATTALTILAAMGIGAFGLWRPRV
jgi:hypothetical protein